MMTEHVTHPTRSARRSAVAAYLQSHPDRSNKWIAGDTGSSDKTVERIRVELEAAGEIPVMERLLDVGGKERPRRVGRASRPALLEVRIVLAEDEPARIAAHKGETALEISEATAEALFKLAMEIEESNWLALAGAPPVTRR